MTTPLVLVPCDVKFADARNWHAVAEQYVEAVVVGAGAAPLLYPGIGTRIDFDAVLERVDGVMLTGSPSNVHPSRYGVAPAPEYEPYDEARDATTLPLIRRVLELGVPLLAICRGFQELNVALGGTLATEIQEEPGRMDHRAPFDQDMATRYRIKHPVRIAAGSCIGRILDDADAVDVNSLHRQAIRTLAPGLAVEAVADDGTIEAVRVDGARGFAVGVQWHPEYWVKTDAPSARIFAAFADACRARMLSRAGLPLAAE